MSANSTIETFIELGVFSMENKVVCYFCESVVNKNLEHCESCGVSMDVVLFVLDQQLEMQQENEREESPRFTNPNFVPLSKMDLGI